MLFLRINFSSLRQYTATHIKQFTTARNPAELLAIDRYFQPFINKDLRRSTNVTHDKHGSAVSRKYNPHLETNTSSSTSTSTSTSTSSLFHGMSVLALGTSSGTPTVFRNSSGFALRLGGRVYLFDCGEGTQRQFLNCNVKPSHIDSIFISHMHGDHVFGLPAMVVHRAMAKAQQNNDSTSSNPNRKTKNESLQDRIRIYGPPGLFNYLAMSLQLAKVSMKNKGLDIEVFELLGGRQPVEPYQNAEIERFDR